MKLLKLQCSNCLYRNLQHSTAQKAGCCYHYPPAGQRRSANLLARASKYGLMMIVLFIKHQVESEKDGVISAVDGVDCVVIGPLYPRASTRYFWGPGHEKVKEETGEAEQEVVGRIKKKGSVAFLDGFAMAHDDLMSLKESIFITL